MSRLVALQRYTAVLVVRMIVGSCWIVDSQGFEMETVLVAIV